MVSTGAFCCRPFGRRRRAKTDPRAADNKNPERVAAGLKAAMHNPNVSGEAKEHAAERLEQMGMGTGSRHEHTQHYSTGQDANRVLGGYKATLHIASSSLLPVYVSSVC